MRASTVASAARWQGAALPSQQRRGTTPGGSRRAPRTQVVAAVASMPKSSSPLLEGLVAEGIITAHEAATCTPDQLEFLIRKRFDPDSSPEQTSMHAYVADGLISKEELERCTPDQLDFLIRKRGSSPPAPAAANVVPFPSPAKQNDAPRRSGPPASTSPEPAPEAGLRAFIADGILTPDEVEQCSPAQLEFLIRKRSPSPPPRGARAAARAPARPPPTAEPAPRQSEADEAPEFVQLTLEEYLAQGVVTEYEIENCSPHQLEFLIRKRLTQAAAEASPPPPPSRGRSRGPVRVPPVAAVQAAAAPAAPAPAVEEPPRKLVVPRAPPLTDDPDAQRRSLSPVARLAAEQLRQQQAADASVGSWVGAVAAAGLTVVGLSAGLYFTGRDSVPPPAEPAAVQQKAPAKADAARLADKDAPAAAAKAELPARPEQAPPPPPAAKADSKAEAPKPAAAAPAAALKAEAPKPAPAAVPAAPKAEDGKPAAPAAASAAEKTAAPAAPAVVKAADASSTAAAEKLAASLAADLAKQKTRAPAPAPAPRPRQLSTRQLAAGGALAVAGALAAGLLAPGARDALVSRFGGEAAVLRSAGAKAASLQRVVEAQQGDLRLLQAELGVAQAEYGAALAKLNGARGALESLSGRVASSERAAKALLADLDRFPSKEAQRLKGEAAALAASVSTQRMAVEKALQRALKDL